MRIPHVSLLTLAVTAAVASAPALAQDADPGSSRFAVVGGIAHVEPTGHGELDGSKLDFDGAAAPALSASYYVTDNIAIEGWGVIDGASHRVVRQGDGKVATVESSPYALSGQYHFGDAQSTVRPFVGLGYFQANISDETADGSDRYEGRHIGMTTPKGAMATVGVDLNFTPHLFARADARYLHGNTDIAVSGVESGESDFNPVVVGVGVGARF